MKTFFLIVTAMFLIPACGSSGSGSASPDTAETVVRQLDFTQFEAPLATLTDTRRAELDAVTRDGNVSSLRAAVANNELTSRELVLFYLSRIRALDPALASVIELNPEALVEADRLDALHARGRDSGRLHGLPILLKDNIATGDQLHNTAGAAALLDHRAPRDSFVVGQLRDAGAIILGKANMSEWAYFMSSAAPSGYSALGGQVVNPFGEEFDVFGSSTGSAVAAAARFAAATVGTETTGSIISPAAANGVAGIRPTLGLVSGDLIIPISASLDTAGPMGRSVTDLAELLTVMAARDDSDANAPLAEDAHGLDFTVGLEGRSLDGLRIGVPIFTFPAEGSATEAVLERVAEALEAAGASIMPVTIPDANLEVLVQNQLKLLSGSMADDLAAYLRSAAAPIESVADVIAFNELDLESRAPFGQDRLIGARDEALDPGDRDALAIRMRNAAREAITMATAAEQVDVLLSLDNSFSLVYAIAGVPAVTVPAGLDAAGQPHGATFVGLAPATDADTLAIARAFERATNLRQNPPLR